MLLKKHTFKYFVTFLLISFVSSQAMAADTAATVETVANSIIDNLNGQTTVVKLMGYISYIIGIIVGIQAALKLKAWNESRGQIPFSVPLLYMIGAAMFIAMPTLINFGAETLFKTSEGVQLNTKGSTI